MKYNTAMPIPTIHPSGCIEYRGFYITICPATDIVTILNEDGRPVLGQYTSAFTAYDAIDAHLDAK